MKHVRKTVTYEVGTADVQLAVVIGSGQIGSSIVYRGDNELGRGSTMLSLPLGPGADLAGTRIEVWSFAQDVLTQTNRVSVEYLLTGGARALRHVATAIVAKHLDLCRFTTVIRFVSSSRAVHSS